MTDVSSPADSSTPSVLHQVVAQVQELYTLPAVALEVVKLTGEPKIDCRRLKEAIELDPGLTCKILRFVNSPMYGLSREVQNLQEALAILGTNTLKLLVLGFSLPSNLLSGIEKTTLGRYWRLSLTKGVAAKEISRRLFGQSGDEAFIGGMLQHVGMLALIQQLGSSYTHFLSRVWEEHEDFRRLETASMGFDHTVLSARLLEAWSLPAELIHAVGSHSLRRSPTGQSESASSSQTATLGQILHMADLVTQLLIFEDSSQLEPLHVATEELLGGPTPALQEALDRIPTEVDQLAELLDLELADTARYQEVLERARQRLTELAALSAQGDRQAAAKPTAMETNSDDSALPGSTTPVAESSRPRASLAPPERAESASPSHAVHPQLDLGEKLQQLFGGSPATPPGENAPFLAPRTESETLRHLDMVEQIAARAEETEAYAEYHPDGNAPRQVFETEVPLQQDPGLSGEVARRIARCRSLRKSLALALVEIDDYQAALACLSVEQLAERVSFLERFVSRVAGEAAQVVRVSDGQVAALLEVEFEEAGEMLRTVQSAIQRWSDQQIQAHQPGMTLSIGLAGTGVPPRNFRPEQLLERAERCLSAARHFGGDTIKSIVF